MDTIDNTSLDHLGRDPDERSVAGTCQPVGQLSFEVVDGETGTHLPARLHFAYADGRSELPTVGRFKNVLVTASGRETRSIPVGRYEVCASRGIEYTLDRQEVSVDEGHVAHLRFTLSRAIDTRGFISSDFHVHLQGALCDGPMVAAAEGLDLLTALVRDARVAGEVKQHADRLELGRFLASMVGVEAGTDFGHFNVFPLTTPAHADVREALVTTRSPGQMLRLMREDPGDEIAQINHPRHGPSSKGYFNGRVNAESFEIESPDLDLGFDQVEVFNALTDGVRSTDSLRPKELDWEGYIGRTAEAEQNLNDWFSLLNRGVLIAGTGTTDVIINRDFGHGSNPRCYPYLLPGYPRTFVASETDDPREIAPGPLVDALRRRASTSSCGPFIRFTANDGAPVGSLVTATDRSVVLHITVEAAPWIPVDTVEVVGNGRVLQRFPVESGSGQVRFKTDMVVEPQRDTWYMVIATSERPWPSPFSRYRSFSFTNPIFVDVDRNGVFDAMHPYPTLTPG